MAHQLAAVLDLLRHPGALDGVGVVDADGRVVQGELAHLLAGALGGVEAGGGLLDDAGVEHGNLRNAW
ncbi:hypothetical protein D3C81_2024530 [compost metagenome]